MFCKESKDFIQLASHYAEVLGARLTPVLTAVREEAVGGQYALVLEFQVRRTRVSDLRTHPFVTSSLGCCAEPPACRLPVLPEKKHQGALLAILPT